MSNTLFEGNYFEITSFSLGKNKGKGYEIHPNFFEFLRFSNLYLNNVIDEFIQIIKVLENERQD